MPYGQAPSQPEASVHSLDDNMEKQNQDAQRDAEEDAQDEIPSETTFPDGGLQAWSVAISASFALFCTFGYANSFGVFQEYYETHQLSDATPSAISWIGSMLVFFLFSGALFGGPLFDRYGAKVMWPAAAAFVLSVMMTSISKSYYQFMLAQGVLGGFGIGMTMAPAMAAVGQYFNKKRGAAMGMAVAGSSLGGVIFPIALNKMFHSSLGFGWSVRICGFIMVALLAPAAAVIRARLPPKKGPLFLLSAFKEKPYISILFAVFLMMLGVFIPLFYLPSYAIAHGMDTELASYLIAILNAASFFGRVVPGIMADKVGPLNMLSASAICSGILAFCWQRMTTNATIIVFAALYGFTSGAMISLLSVALARVPKDPRNIGTYMGMGMFVVAFGALIGPPINGALLNRDKSFDPVSNFSGAVVLAGGFAVLLAKQATEKGLFGKV